MSYQIERNIPLPKGNFTRSGKDVNKALRELEIGDSVLLPSEDKKFSFHAYAVWAKIKITQRRESDTHVRVWRTA